MADWIFANQNGDPTEEAAKFVANQRDLRLELAQKGYRSQTQVLEAQSALDASQAAVRQAEIALSQVNIRAPFSGVFDRRDAEIGTAFS